MSKMTTRPNSPSDASERLRLDGDARFSVPLASALGADDLAWSADRIPGWGPVFLAATASGVCRLDLRPALDPVLAFSRAARAMGLSIARREDALLGPMVESVVSFLRDPHGSPLALPVDVLGSAFQCKVWEALTRIPVGGRRSYGEVAEELGSAARAVGGACGANPVPLIVPCHRVVAAAGGLGGFALGPSMKQALLEAEGGQQSLVEMA